MTHKLTLAGGTLFDRQGKVLLLHRNMPKRTQWEMPGGKVETGELPEATVVRELDAIKNELSPNTQNFLAAYRADKLNLEKII